jgi:hypothetical protein
MLWPNWFLRASYRYAEFGTVSFNVTDVVTGGVAAGSTFITSTMDLKLRTHTASFGIAYKFGESAATAYAADKSAMPVKAPDLQGAAGRSLVLDRILPGPRRRPAIDAHRRDHHLRVRKRHPSRLHLSPPRSR